MISLWLKWKICSLESQKRLFGSVIEFEVWKGFGFEISIWDLVITLGGGQDGLKGEDCVNVG